MAERDLIVVSDLHVSAGPLDDFDREIERHFVDFLGTLGARPRPAELVINGDFLDFVQAPPSEGKELESKAVDGTPLCFTEEQSARKLAAILEEHGPLFDALSRLLRDGPHNRLVILPGNHDPDLFWSAVQRTLVARLAGDSANAEERIFFHLDRAYRSPEYPAVWIEHGHQFDEVNRFLLDDRELWGAATPPILEDSVGRARLFECLGTRLLIRFLNRLDHDYPLVDNIKPFSLFVNEFANNAFRSGGASAKALLTVWKLLKFLVRTGLTEPRSLLSAEDDGRGATEAVVEMLREMAEQSEDLQERIRKVAAGTPERSYLADLPLAFVLKDEEKAEDVVDLLADHPEVLEGLEADDDGYLSEGVPGTLSLAGGFKVNEGARLRAGAARTLADPQTAVVVMGHTHQPHPASKEAAYLNTGSWTRYYEHQVGQDPPPWSALTEAAAETFPYSLKYVVCEAAAPTEARLETFAEGP